MSTDPKPVPEDLSTKDYVPLHSTSAPVSHRKVGIATGLVSLISAAAIVTFSGAAGVSNPIEAVPAPAPPTTSADSVLPLEHPDGLTHADDYYNNRKSFYSSDYLTANTPPPYAVSGYMTTATVTVPPLTDAEEARLIKAEAAYAARLRALTDNGGFAPVGGVEVGADAPRKIAPEDRLAWPIKEHGFSSNFGFRSDPFTHEQRFHTGLDMGGACGTPIFASEDGVVEAAGNTYGGYGIRIVVKHREDLSTTYNHLQQIQVKVGQKVKLGDQIGLMGTTGRSTGCHLHFEVIKDGYLVSPWSWLTGKPDTVAIKVKVGSIFPVGSSTPPDNGSQTSTPSATPSPTSTPTATPTPSPTPTSTPTSTTSPTPTTSPTATPTPTAPPTSTPTPTVPPTTSPTPTPPPTTSPSPTTPAPTTPPASPSPTTPPPTSPEPTPPPTSEPTSSPAPTTPEPTP